MQGWLSTHILDTSSGLPAGNVKLLLSILGIDRQEQLVETYTNSDGRTETPLLEGEKFVCGIYEISFYIGDYFGMRNSQSILDKLLTSNHKYVILLYEIK